MTVKVGKKVSMDSSRSLLPKKKPVKLWFLSNDYYTKTIKYPTVCPIYLIKWPFFDWSKKYLKHENFTLFPLIST